jgi:drug/metabolite transporter (DMT)-like permease
MPLQEDDAHGSHSRAFAALALGVFAIGWSALFVRWSAVPGWTSAFWRMTIAQLVFVPWALAARGRAAPHPPRAAVIAAMIAGAFFAADLALFNTAVMISTAANATLLGVNAPVFVALGAWLLYRERPTAGFWLGFLLSLSGVIAIVGVDLLRHPTLGRGDALALAGAVCYAGYLLFVRRSRAGLDALTFSAISGVTAAVCLGMLCLVIGSPMHGYPASSWWALLGLALVTQVVGHLSVAYSLGQLPVAITSVALLGQAPLTALLAIPLLHEPLRPKHVVGGALVLAGIFIVTRPTRGATALTAPLIE